MRKWIVFLVLSAATPVSAQEFGSSSGASSSIYMNSPSSTTSKNRLVTPPTVVPPGLAAAGVETCLGSTSGGVSLMGGGVTFGTTKVDDGCTIRLLARQLFAFGFQKAAVALMCQDERVAVAMEAAGTYCPGRTALTAYAEARERSPVSAAPAAQRPAREETAAPLTRNEQAMRDEQAWFARASN